MTELVAKISVGYVVFCEWFMGLFLAAATVQWWNQALEHQNESKGIDAMMASILICFAAATGFGLIWRKRLAWFSSLLLGVGFLFLGCSSIWDSTRNTPYAQMEGGLLFGAGALLALSSGTGIVLLNLSPTRRFFFSKLPSPPSNS